jgi:hypothetical protein
MRAECLTVSVAAGEQTMPYRFRPHYLQVLRGIVTGIWFDGVNQLAVDSLPVCPAARVVLPTLEIGSTIKVTGSDDAVVGLVAF